MRVKVLHAQVMSKRADEESAHRVKSSDFIRQKSTFRLVPVLKEDQTCVKDSRKKKEMKQTTGMMYKLVAIL